MKAHEYPSCRAAFTAVLIARSATVAGLHRVNDHGCQVAIYHAHLEDAPSKQEPLQGPSVGTPRRTSGDRAVQASQGDRASPSLHGFTRSNPSRSKSEMFRVARAAPCRLQMAAIWASKPLIGAPRSDRVTATSA